MADAANPQEFVEQLAERLAQINDTDLYDDAGLGAFADEVRQIAADNVEAALGEANDPAAHEVIAACAAAGEAIGAETERRATERAEAAERSKAALTALGVTNDNNEDEEDEEEPVGTETATAGTATVEPDLTGFAEKVTAATREAMAAATEPETAETGEPAPVEPVESDMTESEQEATSTQEATLSEPTHTTEDSLDLSTVADPATALAVAAGGNATLVAEPAGALDRLWAQPNRLRKNRRSREFTTVEPRRFKDLGHIDPTGDTSELPGKRALAKLVGAKFDQVKRMELAAPGHGRLYLAHAEAPDFGERLGGDPIANMAILQDAMSGFRTDVAVAASGGSCAIPTNNYDVFNAATEQGPVGGFLRAVSADRGGIRYLSAPNWADAQAGVAVTTDAEDTLGYTNETPAGSTTPKVCVHFDCPEELECIVDAVSACAEFGNLTHRTAVELVEVLLDQLAVAHEQAKEITYLDAIEAGSTAVTADADVYGAFRNVVWSLGNAVWAYRKRNHIGRTMPIDVLLPDTIIPILKADAVADLHLGAEFMAVDQETLAAQLFESMNLNVEFYYDYSTAYGPVEAMQNAQGAGNIGNWPLSFRGYIYAPGTWVRLDGGTLDVGLVRDSTLNSQNNLQLFSEEWVQACKLGYESVAFDFNLCPSGEGPTPVTGRACTS